MIHRLRWRAPSERALDFWQGRLESEGVAVEQQAGDARTHTGRAADEGDPGDGDPPPVVQRIEIA